MAIGNGWVDPYVQYPQYAEFAHDNKLIGDTQYYSLIAAFAECQDMITNSNWLYALEYCQLMVMTILGNPLNPAFNVYDIREKCAQPPLCYDFSDVDKMMNRPDI